MPVPTSWLSTSYPFPQPVSADSIDPEQTGQAAYTRLLAEINTVAKELTEAENALQSTKERYTAIVAMGDDAESKRSELQAISSRVEQLRERYASLRPAAEEARIVAVQGVTEVLRDRRSEAFSKSLQVYDAAIKSMAEAVQAHIGDLAAARAAWLIAAQQPPAAASIVPGLPQDINQAPKVEAQPWNSYEKLSY